MALSKSIAFAILEEVENTLTSESSSLEHAL